VNYRTTDFVEVASGCQPTDTGLDVAFDAVGGNVTLETFKCMGFNGRHLIAGWSEGIELEDGHYLTPRAMAYGNFSLCGVCLVYVNTPSAFAGPWASIGRVAATVRKPTPRSSS